MKRQIIPIKHSVRNGLRNLVGNVVTIISHNAYGSNIYHMSWQFSKETRKGKMDFLLNN